MKKKQVLIYFALYSLCFVLMVPLIYLPFLRYGRSFIWQGDGLMQHYTALRYYGRWLREIWRILLEQHRLVIPEYSFHLGLGSNIIRTLHYYVIGDPLNILSAFVPEGYTYQLYRALIIARVYLAGAAFSLYCIEKKNMHYVGLLIGSMTYAFCGYVLYAAVRHPYFINPMIYLPLICMGVDRVLDKKKPTVYLVTVFIAGISNFYFLYMLVLMTAVYILIRLIAKYKNQWKDMLADLGKLVLYSAVSALMSGVIILPVISSFLGDSRMSASVDMIFAYPDTYYRNFMLGFSFYDKIGYWTRLGFGSAAVIAVYLLFRRKSNWQLKIFFLLGTIGLMIPYTGSVLNGFSYISNRWCFVYAFIVAYAVTKMWPEIVSLKPLEAIELAFFILAYCYIAKKLNIAKIDYHLLKTATVLFAVTAACPVFISLFKSKWLRILGQMALSTFCIGFILFNAMLCYSPGESNYLDAFLKNEYFYDEIPGDQADPVIKKQISENNENELTRYTGRDFKNNSSLLYDTCSTQYFWSLSNPYIAEMRSELAMREDKAHVYMGFDDSTFLNALAGVGYYTSKDDMILPYGYELCATKEDSLIYKNEYTLPVGYTYDDYIKREDYNALSSVDKQAAMMQSAVLETDIDGLKENKPVLDSQSVPYEVSASDPDVTLQGNRFVVTKKDASIFLLLNTPPDCETEVCFKNISYHGNSELKLYNDDKTIDPNDLYGEKELEAMTEKQIKKLREADMRWEENDYPSIYVSVKHEDGMVNGKRLQFGTEAYAWFNNRSDYNLNMGYAHLPITKVKLTFSDLGSYGFDDLQVICQPIDNYEKWVSERSENVLENITFSEDSLTGAIHTDREKLLCLAIPYDSGWTAWVDGSKAELVRTNTAYMGLVLPEGDHQIQLIYKDRALRLGACMSAAGLLICCFIIAKSSKKANCNMKK